MKRILSWGMGTQSTALAVMSALGDFSLPKLDYVIAADTGWERKATYEIQRFYRPWLEERDIQVEIVSIGNIRKLAKAVNGHMPFFSQDGGPLRRQCTREYKIRPIRRLIRELLGYPADRPPHPPIGAVEQWLGISLDEYERMKSSDVQFIIRHPLVQLGLTRGDCIRYLEEKRLPVPVKSACIGCPYRSPNEWLEIQQEAPEEFRQAVEFDETIRHHPLMCDISKGEALYLWNGLRPIAEVDWKTQAEKKRKESGKQMPLFIPCDGGYCHV